MKLAQVCSEMIPNKLKQLWSQGKPTINGWCSIANPFTAKIVAAQGYDSITMRSIKSALPMLQVSGVIPMARVPWMEPGIIMKILDAGAYGVICPMVNNAIPVSTESMSGPLTSPLGWRKAASPRASTARSPR